MYWYLELYEKTGGFQLFPLGTVDWTSKVKVWLDAWTRSDIKLAYIKKTYPSHNLNLTLGFCSLMNPPPVLLHVILPVKRPIACLIRTLKRTRSNMLSLNMPHQHSLPCEETGVSTILPLAFKRATRTWITMPKRKSQNDALWYKNCWVRSYIFLQLRPRWWFL